MAVTPSSAGIPTLATRDRTNDSLLVDDLGSARELIHGALEFLCHYDERPRIDLDFKKAFGATDTLLDMDEALHALARCEWPNDLGMAYLVTMGALQALVAQQDATQRLCEVFGVKFIPHKSRELIRIRDLRVRAAGHPQRFALDPP